MLALVPSACGWYTNVQPWRMPPRSHDAAVMTANFRPGYTWRSARDSSSVDGMQLADWSSSVNVSDAVSGASARLIPQSDPGDTMLEEQRVLVMKTATTAFLFADTDKSGALDFGEMVAMMQRMNVESSTTHEEVANMFASVGLANDEMLTYEHFTVLLSLSDSQSSLFTGLLTFATAAVEAGVQAKLSKEDPPARGMLSSSFGSHILDDGSSAWRDSVEAAFALCDEEGNGSICKLALEEAISKYPLICQLLRLPLGLSETDKLQYMGELFDVIDEDRSGDLELGEWMNFFCRNREAVPRPTEWDPDSPACAAITGYIFDCDGTLYQPSGPIPGAEASLEWIEQTGHQFVFLSNTGAQSSSAVDATLARLGLCGDADSNRCYFGRTHTAADAQVEFMMSGQLPAGSKVLLLAADDGAVERLKERDAALYASWEVARSLDVATAKEWSVVAEARRAWEDAQVDAHAAKTGAAGAEGASTPGGDRASASGGGAAVDEAPPSKVAVVFFHDGPLAGDSWSYELIHATTILLSFGAEFIYTAEDPVNPSIDARYPDKVFPMPGPGMFVEMLRKAMPPLSKHRRMHCCGKGGNVGRRFMIERAIRMLQEQGHSGDRDTIMIVGDRFDTDIRAGVLAGIKSCLLESGAHSLALADEFPTDIPSFTCPSIADLVPTTNEDSHS